MTTEPFSMKKTVYILSIRPKNDKSLQSLCDSVDGFGWEPVVVSGVVGRELSAGEYFDGIRSYLSTTRRLMSPGEVGCTLGHLKIWRTIAESTASFGVVLEDDALLDDQFGGKLEALIDYCGAMDCFVSLGGQETSLGFTRSLRGRKIKELEDTWEIYPSELGKLFGTVGYMVSKATARRMVEEASKALFVADDFGLLYRSGAIKSVFLSNVVGHPWGDHHSAIGSERDFLFETVKLPPRPLMKRLAQEIKATVSARLQSASPDVVPQGAELVEWNSRFRRNEG